MNTIARQALLLASKDTRIFFRDRAALAFAFLLPFIFVIGFTLALRDVGPEDEALQFTLATQETAGISVLAIESIATEPGGLIVAMKHSEALEAVDSGDIAGFVSFPADFTQRYLAGETAPLEVYVGNVPAADEAALRGFAQEIAARFSEARATLSAVIALGSPEQAARAMERLLSDTSRPGRRPAGGAGGRNRAVQHLQLRAAGLPDHVRLLHRRHGSGGPGPRTPDPHAGAADGQRRAPGIAHRGQVPGRSPHRRGAGGGHVDRGRSGVQCRSGRITRAVIVLSLLMVLASAGFAVLLASFVSNVRTASAAGVLTSLVLAPLGGSWWPLFIAPQFMQQLARLTPHGWANDGLNRLMLFGAEFGDVLPSMLALLVFAAVFLTLALWRFRMAPGE